MSSATLNMVKAATVQSAQADAVPEMTKLDWSEIVQDALAKLAIVRRHLITRAPLVASCVMKMAIRISYRTKTMATDGRYLIVNPDFLEDLDVETASFVIAHEALHCALGHLTRRGEREPYLWNVAADYVDNGLLKQAGMSVPEWVLQDDRYLGRSAEEVYAHLYQQRQANRDNKHYREPNKSNEDKTADHDTWEKDEEVWPYDKGEDQTAAGEGPRGSGPSPEETDDETEAKPWTFEEEGDGTGKPIADRMQDAPGKWRQAMSEAVEEARASGNLTAEVELALSDMNPIVDWKQELHAYFSRKAGQKRRTNWNKVRKYRMPGGGRYFMPRSMKEGCRVGAIVDVSGSVGAKERSQFVSELGRIVQAIKGSTLDMLLVTDEIVGEFRGVRRVADLPLDEISTKSGLTEFSKAFDWFASLPPNEKPDAIVVLTDGYLQVEYDKPRGMEVVWCVTVPGGYDDYFAKPWGKTLKLDPHA